MLKTQEWVDSGMTSLDVYPTYVDENADLGNLGKENRDLSNLKSRKAGLKLGKTEKKVGATTLDVVRAKSETPVVIFYTGKRDEEKPEGDLLKISLPKRLQHRLTQVALKVGSSESLNPASLLLKEKSAEVCRAGIIRQRQGKLQVHHDVVFARMKRKFREGTYDMEKYLHLPPRLFRRVETYSRPTSKMILIRQEQACVQHEKLLMQVVADQQIKHMNRRYTQRMNAIYKKNFVILGDKAVSGKEAFVAHVPERLMAKVRSYKERARARSVLVKMHNVEKRRQEKIRVQVSKLSCHNSQVEVIRDARKESRAKEAACEVAC